MSALGLPICAARIRAAQTALAYLSVARSTLSPARSTDLSTFSPARSNGPSRSQAARPPSNSIAANTGIADFFKLTMRCPPSVLLGAADTDSKAARVSHSQLQPQLPCHIEEIR